MPPADAELERRALRADAAAVQEQPAEHGAAGDREQLHGGRRDEQDGRGGEHRDRGRQHAAGEAAPHLPHGQRHHRHRRQLQAVHPAGAGQVAVAADAVGERDHGGGRRQREAEPGSEAAERAGAMEADREAELARGGAGQELRQSDQVGEGVVVEPAAADDVVGAEVADVRGRPAERGQPEPERRREHLRGACRPGPRRVQATVTPAVWSAPRTASAARWPEAIDVSVYEPPR